MSYLTAGQPSELERLMDAATAELTAPTRWGNTFTLIQAWERVP